MSSSTQPLTQHELDQKPWKYIGYHGYATFLASDSDFCNFRRFERLNTRVILALQDDLSQLEESLDETDRSWSARDAPDVNNGSFRQDPQQVRVDLIWEAQQKLEEYNRYLYHYFQLRRQAPVEEKDINSLRNWHHNHDGAITAEERKYVEKNDLFVLVPKDRSPLRRLLERSSRFRFFRLWKTSNCKNNDKPNPELPFHTQQHIHYSSDKRIDRFVTLTTIATGLIMIIAPIWILAYTDPAACKLAVITVFIFLFLTLVSLGTNAKPYESLAATAAYSAILMVFLQMGAGASELR
ncbi:hypothetical protein BJX70DRAFT_350980 [Aspergillus crustosus]